MILNRLTGGLAGSSCLVHFRRQNPDGFGVVGKYCYTQAVFVPTPVEIIQTPRDGEFHIPWSQKHPPRVARPRRQTAGMSGPSSTEYCMIRVYHSTLVSL